MISKIDVHDVLDDRLKQEKPFAKAYYGSNVSFESAACIGGTPNTSKNSFNLSLVPANFMDRRPLLHAVWTQTFTISSGGANTANNTIAFTPGVDFYMNSYPFQRMLGVCSSKVNNKLVSSFELGRYIDELLRISDVEGNIKKGTCPSALDFGFSRGLDGYLTNSQSGGTYNEASMNFVPNGAWTFKSITAGATAAGAQTALNANYSLAAQLANGASIVVTLTMETYEPLLLPPFLINQKDEEALFALSNVQIDLPIDVSKISRIICSPNLTTLPPLYGGDGAAALDLNWSTMALNGVTTLEILYETFPVPNIRNYHIPQHHIIHSYDMFPTYIAGSFGAGTSQLNLAMTQVRTSSMPHRVLLFAKPVNPPPMGWNNYYYQLSALKVNLSGFQQNMLASASQFDLYRLSCQAGLKQDYLSWNGKAYALSFAADGTAAANQSVKSLVGGPIVLIPGISFPLPEGVTTGSAGSYTFDFTATVTNNTADNNVTGQPGNGAFNFNVIFLYDQYVQVNTETLECVVQHAELKIGQTEHLAKAPAVVSEEAEPVGGILHSMNHSGANHAVHQAAKPRKLASRLKK